MNSSPKTNSSDPLSLPAHHVGLMLGLTAGLGLYALYSTKSGRDFNRWLRQTTNKLHDDLQNLNESSTSNTYQELVNLVDFLKSEKGGANLSTSPSPSGLLSSFKTHFFADSQPITPTTSPKKISPHRFHKQSRKTRSRS